MDKFEKGIKLNQLSRLTFNSASNIFYSAILIEIGTGLILVIGSKYNNIQFQLLFAIIGFIAAFLSYCMKLMANAKYENADTMRRQSVLTEGLGLEIDQVQFNMWQNIAGKKTLNEWRKTDRNPEYYKETQETGFRRLLEMTNESSFWTRNLYLRLKDIFIVLFLILLLVITIVFTIIFPLFSPSTETIKTTSYFIYLLLPVIFSIDIIGIIINLNKSINDLYNLETLMNDLLKKDPDSINTFRLLSEYNCIVVQGIPIPQLLFKKWYKEIDQLYNETYTY